jgi:TolA-binding protein
VSRLEKDLAHEPQAALAYAYYIIYNYSINSGNSSPPYEEVKDYKGKYDPEATRARNDELEKKWRAERAEIANKELSRTLDFSTRLITNHPNLPVGGAFALRAAQASEELGDNGSAIKFAQRALQSGLSAGERAQALWTLGVAQYRVPNYNEARRNLLTLLRDYPNINLIEKTRRLLAMISEDAGDIDGALEQYVALGYDIDEAYFVDTLMTPEQLAAFIQKHPDSPKKNEFTYALGMRYLRANRWEDARRTFAQVRTEQESNYDYYCMTCNCEGSAYRNCTDPKEKEMGASEDEAGKKQVSSTLLLRDVQTANDLEALERATHEAVGDEAKAEALYQYASYQYEASSLLFYNPLASPGYVNLGEFANYGRYRAANESQVLFDSTQEHERLARALKIYLEIAQKFPRTRAARDALYTAAVCHERLSNYNPYWRLIYENGMHAGQRMVTYKDVIATYPNYQLPRGTYGWQPSTRTVNGGPGWAPPPPPAPKPKRLTKRERVRLFVNDVSVRANAFWQEKGKRWLTESLIVFVLVLTVRIARRNQRRLRARIARQRIEQLRQVVTYPWFDWFWIDPVVPSRREQIRKLLGDKRQEFLDLARDRRSRPVLLRSIVSHSAVTGLVVSLIWTIWFG